MAPTISKTPQEAGIQITRDNIEWGTTLGTAVGPISYGFRASPPPYNVAPYNVQETFLQFTSAQIDAANLAIQLWGDLANISFTRVGTGNSGASAYTDSATILFADFSNDSYPYFAFSPSPGGTNFSASNGDVWINAAFGIPPTVGGDFKAYLHELGHALGLEHPANYSGSPIYNTDAQYIEDSIQYTVMSYFDASNTGANHVNNGNTIYASTPLLDDITAIQRLYGANMTIRTSDTVYGFNSNADRSVFHLASATQQVVFAIWDAGGNDALDFSGYSTNQIINLTPGSFSNVGALTKNVAIAVGTVIESAIGGSGNDTITGNDSDNTLRGNGGNDTIDGGLGIDSAVFSGLRSAYTLTDLGNSGVRVSGPDGTDTLTNVENLVFNDVTVSLARFLQPTSELSQFGAGPGAGGWASENQYPRELADVNGDGSADIVAFGYAGMYVTLATGGGHFGQPTLQLSQFGAGAGAGGWSSDNQYPRMLADVNGDHLADLVAFGYAGTYVALATGGGHFAQPTLELSQFGAGAGAGGWSSNDQYPRELADVNGDGLADIVAFGYAGMYVTLATGGGHFAQPALALSQFGAGAGAGGWSSNDQYPRLLADVNGDHMADLVAFGYAGTYVALATGSGHFAQPTLELTQFGAGAGAGSWSSNDQFPRELADVNGDAMADIVAFGYAGTYVALATGGGHFAQPTLESGQFGAGAGAGGWSSNDRFPRELGDINGDHMADIVAFGYGGVSVALAHNYLLS